MIVFGDVNGDSYVDGQDTVLMRAYAASMLRTGTSTHHILYAGDIDFNGSIGKGDADMTEQAGLKKITINQAPEQYTDKTFTFIDLVTTTRAMSL